MCKQYHFSHETAERIKRIICEKVYGGIQEATETDSAVTMGWASVKSGFAEATVKLANGLDLTSLRVMIDSLIN